MTLDWGVLETILVVDDDRNVCTMLKRQLERADYLVHTVHSGTDALAFARESRADLVILDLVMPGLDGIATCTALREIEGWQEPPVLILTGTYDDNLYRQAMSCGADDFLTKPVRTEELLLRVKSLIRVRSLVAGLRASVATIETQNALILENREQREKLQAFLLHDLKNPIAGILLQAELMVDQEVEVPEPWRRIVAGAEHLMKLVASWMDHIKAERTGIQPSLAQVPVQPFLEGILGRHELWFKVRRINGAVEVGEPGLAHAMDPVLMDRVVGNLLDNCLRYSPEGGRLCLSADRTAAGTLHLAVTDQGPGVPLDQREHMFDLYAQLETPTNRAQGRQNRGLGLAFCKAAVESHGGHIWMDENPGGGSRFNIELPNPAG